jgi:hypothetical protein
MSTRKIRKSRKDLYAYRKKLPFFDRKRGTSATWWNVSPTGNYETDYQTGQEYAAAFWRVSGTTGCAGSDLGQILLAMHEPSRKKSKRHNGLSGIEIGFIRGIGDIIDIMKVIPALAVQTRRQLRSGKLKVTRLTVNRFTKATQIWLEAKQAQSRKRKEEIQKEFTEKNRQAIRSRMVGQKAAA